MLRNKDGQATLILPSLPPCQIRPYRHISCANPIRTLRRLCRQETVSFW